MTNVYTVDKMRILIGVIFVLFLLVAKFTWAERCENTCQQTLVTSYFDKLTVIYRSGSTPADIDALFADLHPSVSYEHIRYEAQFNREEWHDAFLNNQKNGAYQNDAKKIIKVSNVIAGHSHMAVTYSYGRVDEYGEWEPDGDQDLMALFTIVDGKISRVQEYW